MPPLRSRTDALSEEVQLWASIRDQLRQLDALRDEIAPLQEEYERARAFSRRAADHASSTTTRVIPKLEDPPRPLAEVQASLHPRLQQAHDLSDNAYEKVSILQALLASATNNLELTGRKRRCVDAAPSGLNGASSSGTTSRRTSPATSLSASQPALQADESPQASLEAAPSTAPAKRGRGWRKGLGSSISSSSVPTIAVPTSTANTPSLLGGWTDPARARREQLGPQLPLQPGRKVTFRSPSNKADQVPKDEYEGWIMATVVECINNDRNRYVVRDDDPDVETLYNTTLKAIVPLPESSATLPPRDYPSGHKVLAVYPDSTTFYPATILGGGPGLTRGITKSHKKEQDLLNSTYQLLFDEDGGDVKSVNVTLVVERPRV